MYYKCTACKKIENTPPKPVWLCSCGKPLSVHYGWEEEQRDVSVDTADESLWRYGNVLPEESVTNKVSLGEGWTPLLPIGNNVYIKDETVNPTGSFKDRGMALAITMAKVQGVETMCLPSAGNAGISAAAYCQEAGIECHVFLPETIPEPFKKETDRYNANLMLSGQTISDAAKKMLDNKKDDWFDISTLKEPFRVEGKKTLGYEIAEQLGWEFPDVVIYETGGGTGLIGMWKAFNEMRTMGWVTDPLPRMVAAQSDGCAPVVDAFQNLQPTTQFWQNSQTIALGLNVPGPLGGAWILDILSQSKGIAVTAPEPDLTSLTSEFNDVTGLKASAEAGVVWGAYQSLKKNRWLGDNEKVVLFATGIERC